MVVGIFMFVLLILYNCYNCFTQSGYIKNLQSAVFCPLYQKPTLILCNFFMTKRKVEKVKLALYVFCGILFHYLFALISKLSAITLCEMNDHLLSVEINKFNLILKINLIQNWQNFP